MLEGLEIVGLPEKVEPKDVSRRPRNSYKDD